MVRKEDLISAVSNLWNGAHVSSYNYANDALGRRTARADFAAGEPPVEIQNVFGYNTRSEVTRADMGTNEYTYLYDPIGNRTAATNAGEAVAYAANALNQYSNLQSTAYSLQPSYDPDGNMLTNGPWAYTWDAENRMASAVSNGVLLVTNVYDHQSRRIRKEVYTRASPSTAYSLQSTASFLYDGWNVIREVSVQSSAVSTNYYTWGLDLSGTMQGAGGVGGLLAVTTITAEPGTSPTLSTYYPTYDANGNITAYLDSTGGIAARREFDAFGNTVSLSGPLAGGFSYWFSTKYLDPETGLYYYGYRYYQPDLGTREGRVATSRQTSLLWSGRFCNIQNMPRQIRHNVEGGWYHITARGMGRREIFSADRDREHFVELLQGLVERYGIILHAYVLMDNHYHLLIETPHANASRALQWLNVSYAAWYNAKHDRTGPLFQQRYRGVPVDGDGSWALTCSVYIHLNPVRVQALGLGKEERERARAGFLPKEPAEEQVKARLAKLRGHGWSSYPAYAGYAPKPEWLTCEELWRRNGDGKDGKAEYRRYLEGYLRQGADEGALAQITAAVALGGAAFVERLRRKVPPSARNDTNARAWRRLLPFGEVVRAVEAVKGEEWVSFADRKGDHGRDLALYVARMNCGLSIPELAAFAGIESAAASKALQRMKERLPGDRKLKSIFRKVSAEIGVREK